MQKTEKLMSTQAKQASRQITQTRYEYCFACLIGVIS